MPENSFRIVTNGKPAKGQDPTEVLHRLSKLFKLPPAKVKGLLAGKVLTVRKGLDEQSAMRMLAALRKAGLVCKSEPEGKIREGHRQDGGLRPSPIPKAPTSKAPAPDVRAAMGARTIDPDMGSTSIEHTAMASSEITATKEGMDFHKPGARDVPFSEVLLMAVYEPPSALGGQTKLMVFFSGSKRPLTLSAASIKYWQFEGVTSKSAGVSLRQFIAYVYAHNHNVILDAPTMKYLGGGLPRSMDVDESILSSALGRALAAEGLFREPAGGGQETGLDMGEVLRKIKHAAEPHPEKIASGRARIAMFVTALSMAWVIWKLYAQLGFLRFYGSYFHSSSHTILNHLMMWTNVAALLVLTGYAVLVLKRIRGNSRKARSSFRLYAWGLSVLAIARFVLLAGLATGIRRGMISGGFALIDLTEVLRSKHLLLNALLLSPAAIAVPVLIIAMRIFGSPSEKSVLKRRASA